MRNKMSFRDVDANEKVSPAAQAIKIFTEEIEEEGEEGNIKSTS
jgi:hypothetical protein